MDRDVQAKLDKLGQIYLEASATLELLRPVALPTRKAQQRGATQVDMVLGRLRDSRKPVVGALVKLAYVRAYRRLKPGAKLGADQLEEVKALEQRLDYMLDEIEKQARQRFSRDISRLQLVEVMKHRGTPPGAVGVFRQSTKPYPLEQHARASVHSVVDMAVGAACLSATEPGDYDLAAYAN